MIHPDTSKLIKDEYIDDVPRRLILKTIDEDEITNSEVIFVSIANKNK